MSVRVKRAYEPSSPEDGVRVLTERLWPRGIAKEKLAIDAWLREIAPSPELRRWYNHEPEKWDEFQRRYRRELQGPRQQDLVAELAEKAAAGTLTLVYGSRDTERNSSVILAEVIRERIARKDR
ncbi:MAG: DUF488 family protein [Dehalococcoidia bacterium]|nr:DUF488 family protein [Dehalococcoidia bacterium]